MESKFNEEKSTTVKIMENISIAVLCGGKSTRFKKNKADFFLEKNPLFQNNLNKLRDLSDDLFLQGKFSNKFPKQKIYCDVVCDKGPLGGIFSALINARYEKVFILACDMPKINFDIILELKKFSKNYDIVVPRWKNGYYEPLCAIYSKSVQNIIKNMLKNNELKISHLFEKVQKVKEVCVEKLIFESKISKDCFLNVNQLEKLLLDS